MGHARVAHALDLLGHLELGLGAAGLLDVGLDLGRLRGRGRRLRRPRRVAELRLGRRLAEEAALELGRGLARRRRRLGLLGDVHGDVAHLARRRERGLEELLDALADVVLDLALRVVALAHLGDVLHEPVALLLAGRARARDELEAELLPRVGAVRELRVVGGLARVLLGLFEHVALLGFRLRGGLAAEDVAADLLEGEVERLVVELVLAPHEVVDELALVGRHAVLDALDLLLAGLLVDLADADLGRARDVQGLERRARERRDLVHHGSRCST